MDIGLEVIFPIGQKSVIAGKTKLLFLELYRSPLLA